MSLTRTAKNEFRRNFGRRLKDLRASLSYSQEEMAYALGIQAPRYSKYEIGRSEAPYEILLRIANLTGVDLDYLVVGRSGRGGRRSESPEDQLREFLNIVPTAAILYDSHGKLRYCNKTYLAAFFPDRPSFAKPGTPLEVLARAWGNANGFKSEEIESFIQKRLDPEAFENSPVELRVGPKTLQFAETNDDDFRLVLITDVTSLRRSWDSISAREMSRS